MYLEDVIPLGTLNLLCAIGGLVLLIVTLGLLFDYYANKSRYYQSFIAPFVWQILIGVSVGSVVLSLIYSEYFGFIPCSLCWLQRIALYPQALLVLVAYRLREKNHFPLYSTILSIFGFVVAVYHYVYQLLPKETYSGVIPCLADGSADCAEKIMNVFGFVTFPFLSAVTFAFLITLYLHMRREVLKDPI